VEAPGQLPNLPPPLKSGPADTRDQRKCYWVDSLRVSSVLVCSEQSFAVVASQPKAEAGCHIRRYSALFALWCRPTFIRFDRIPDADM